MREKSLYPWTSTMIASECLCPTMALASRKATQAGVTGFRNMRADAERMGGRLEVVQSETGNGTTVTCTIPYETREDGA